MEIRGELAVVSGASRGIGRATAEALGAAGARLALLARSPEIEDLAAALRARGLDARAFIADVGDAAAVAKVAERIRAELGDPALLINNAGAGRFLAVDETTPEQAAAAIACPYLAAFFLTRAFLPAMLTRGAGLIVNVNSPVSRFTWPGATAYAAARWAMRGFTAGLRGDLAGTGVRVMEAMPGKVSSTYFEHNPGSEDRIPSIARWIPTVTPERVAAAIVRGIERDRREVVLPFMLRFFLLLHRLAPGGVERLVRATGWRRAAGESGRG